MTCVVELAAEQTHRLRAALLRDGTPDDSVVFDGDEKTTTFHLGATIDGELVSISTWMSCPYPDLPLHSAHRLRGMATTPAARGSGVSSDVLSAGLARCSDAASSVVWARARTQALSFYERHGFEVRGPEYFDVATGLPHRDIVLHL